MDLKKKLLRLFFLVEIVLFFIFYFGGPNGINALVDLKEANEISLLDIKKLKFEVEQLEKEVNRWEKNSFYKEKVARERLQMARPGDLIFIY